MKVREIMTTEVITAKEDQTRQQAARLLSQHRMSGLPVVDAENAVVGVVTEHDVIGREGGTVGDIMTRSVISVAPDTDIEEVSHILVHDHIKRVLVLEQGKLIGIVSRADLVRMIVMHWLCLAVRYFAAHRTQPERCPRCGAGAIFVSTESVPPGS
ncbi:MAG TPA: CBS domain-containing protein [Ktedonobacteraceae bacterium]|nr:CBS domain-containing protein [Ktedonobacteraceae bacterium]